MKVSVEKIGSCRVQVNVDVPADAVRPSYDTVLKLYVKNVRIPGFRRGKVPVAMVESRFKKDIFKQVQEELLPKTYQTMLQQESLKPVAVVGLDKVDLSPERGFSYQVVLDLEPEFELPPYQKIPVTAMDTEATEEDVDEAIQRMRQHFSRYEDLTSGVAQAQDLVKVTYKGALDGNPLSGVADAGELAAGEGFWLPLASESEFLPGLNAALIGAEIGQTVTTDIHFPADYRIASLAGKTATYTIVVEALRRRQEPEITEEFLKELNLSSVDELRSQMRAGVVQDKKAMDLNRRREQVGKYLLDNTQVGLPESLVANETTALLKSLLNRMAQAGSTREMLEKHRDEIMGTVAQQAADRVKMSYIGRAIAAAEKITISDADVDREMEVMSMHYRMPVEKLHAEIDKQEGGMDNLRNDILHTKVLDFLVGQAKLTG